MSETAGDAESNSLNGAKEDQGFLHHYSASLATVAAAYFAIFLVIFIAARMWDEDEIRLQLLNTLMRILQTIARTFGGWALACEKAYNDYANTLH